MHSFVNDRWMIRLMLGVRSHLASMLSKLTHPPKSPRSALAHHPPSGLPPAPGHAASAVSPATRAGQLERSSVQSIPRIDFGRSNPCGLRSLTATQPPGHVSSAVSPPPVRWRRAGASHTLSAALLSTPTPPHAGSSVGNMSPAAARHGDGGSPLTLGRGAMAGTSAVRNNQEYSADPTGLYSKAEIKCRPSEHPPRA